MQPFYIIKELKLKYEASLGVQRNAPSAAFHCYRKETGQRNELASFFLFAPTPPAPQASEKMLRCES